jgi:mono/diheme cytochrome c family protein
MADFHLLGLFNNVDSAADAIEKLHKQGISDDLITVISGIPYKPEILGRPHFHSRIGLVSLGGAILGLLGASFLTVGLFLLYPIIVGGQPLVPIPPSLIVFFEIAMLGTMWSAFFGLLWLSGLPAFNKEPYDERITAGYIGVQMIANSRQTDLIERLFKESGAVDLKKQTIGPVIDRKFRMFWGGAAGLLTVGLVVIMLFVYDVIKIPFPSNMVEQDSFGYEQGPRLAAPASAVPIQGPELIAGHPASQPIAASPDSLQRGAVLYAMTCEMCHGSSGQGNGRIAAFFSPKPFDLTSSNVQKLSEDELFVVITQGFGVMPGMAESLSPEERWDVINHIRTLAK